MPERGDAPLRFADLPGWREDDAGAALSCFQASAAAIASGLVPLRAAQPATGELAAAARAALDLPSDPPANTARAFFEQHFAPVRLTGAPFFTGYYEPVVAGSPERSDAFAAPLLARPDDLDTREPYPDRAAVERDALVGEGRYRPLVWLRDWVEVFLIQVQGSARVRLPDGSVLRLTYAGRNRHPYTSIGRLLVEAGEIAPDAMSLDRLKAWLRANGQAPGERGRDLMGRNASCIFFAAAPARDEAGPIGGAGVPLTPLRSLAIDRAVWCYGLPFWIDADLPWTGTGGAQPFRRLMVAQDTGSAIVGQARADLFFGAGDAAGRFAGGIRHGGTLVLLRPKAPDGSAP